MKISNLAKYKVPFKINILVELPKNETGKIMKKNLLTMVSDLRNNIDKVYQVQSSQLK
jgi:acyl-coenzyme A synthetase/AMP-(fatty) acid ligase